MRSLFRAIGRVLFWTYSRGSWQYDVLCVLILAFIFLTPRDFFKKPPFQPREEPAKIQENKGHGGPTGAVKAPRVTTSPVG